MTTRTTTVSITMNNNGKVSDSFGRFLVGLLFANLGDLSVPEGHATIVLVSLFLSTAVFFNIVVVVVDYFCF